MDIKKQLEEIKQRVGEYRLGVVTEVQEGRFRSGEFSPISFSLAKYSCSFGQIEGFVHFLNTRLNEFGLETRVSIASSLVENKNTARFSLSYSRHSDLFDKRESTEQVLQKIPGILDDYIKRKKY